jgi:hypothetical protein
MKFQGRVYRLHKAGNTEDEYEDAYAPLLPGEDHPQGDTVQWGDTFRAAIADGATESILAKSWAKYLVQEYVRKPFSSLGELQQRRICDYWHEQEKKAIAQKPAHLQWCLQEGLVHGADATFLGVSIFPYEGRWKYAAIAVGDCNLFHIRSHILLKAFPLEKPEDFNFTPSLINSREIGKPNPNNSDSASLFTFESYEAECQEGDELWLMTDALACWFLRRAIESSDANVIQQMQQIREDSDHYAFAKMIEEERKHRRLRNDDVTWMIIQLIPDPVLDKPDIVSLHTLEQKDT